MDIKRSKSLRLVFILIVLLLLCFLINSLLFLNYYYQNSVEEDHQDKSSIRKDPQFRKERSKAVDDEIVGYRSLTYRNNSIVNQRKLSFNDLANYVKFNIEGNDVIVFLHIQKTGGTTFGKHLVQDLDIERPCICNEEKKKCKCVRPKAKSDEELWLYSRHSTGWKCGLHADWTELNDCLDRESKEIQSLYAKGQYDGQSDFPIFHDRRYLYVSFLREPIRRFISEYKHVQRGATWKSSRHLCSGRPPTYEELPPCYEGSDWKDEFLSCKSNLALNRQTRMLANLTLVNCYNASSMDNQLRDEIMLESAKENLKNMAFFGLCDYQEASQFMFEKTFNMRFRKSFVQSNETRTSQAIGQFTEDTLISIEKLNYLDIQLYDYALKLFFERYEVVKSSA